MAFCVNFEAISQASSSASGKEVRLLGEGHGCSDSPTRSLLGMHCQPRPSTLLSAAFLLYSLPVTKGPSAMALS